MKFRMEYSEKKSNAWFLLPILIGVIGGIIAFFVLRNSDPAKAKNCLYLGVALMVVGIIVDLIIISFFPEFLDFPEFESGFEAKV